MIYFSCNEYVINLITYSAFSLNYSLHSKLQDVSFSKYINFVVHLDI